MTEVPYQLLDKHPQLEDSKADALRKLVQNAKMRSREAVAVVSGPETFIKLFTLSDLPPAEVADAIKWKFVEEIPFTAEEAIFDFYPLEKGESFNEKVDYVAACISRKLYRETQYVLDKAGIKLAGIAVLPDALRELYQEELARNGEKIVSIIYMGKRTTNISIYRRGSLEFNRELNIGGENITLAMSGLLITPDGKVEISADQAEKIKLEYGVPVDLQTFPKIGDIPLTQFQAMVRPALEKIQSELTRTFEYYKGQTGEAKVDKIILTGGSSQTINLAKFLSEGLGIPVVTPQPLPKLNPRLSAALGAAVVGTRRINLLPEEVKHRYRQQLQKVLKPQVLFTSYLLLLALIYFIVWLQTFSLQSEIKNIDQKMQNYQPRLARLGSLEKASQEEERKRLVFKAYEEKKSRVPAIFDEISKLIPASAFLNVVNLTPDGLHLWGAVFGKGDAAENILSRFVLALSASPLFDNVRLVQAAKNSDYETEGLNYEITAGIKVK
jgi:type IV pilus assembly protein PilM